MTGENGSPAYERQLLEQENESDKTLRTADEGADASESTVTELDEETGGQID